MSTLVAAWYGALLRQIVSEAYFERVPLSDESELLDRLRLGNNRLGFNIRGLTRFTAGEAREFLGRNELIHQLSDNPTITRDTPEFIPGSMFLANTGLSATLIRDRTSNGYTLAIRSTEYQWWEDGGDKQRDGIADAGIFLGAGLPLAQLDALERYYEWLRVGDGSALLPAGAALTVSGYSLGGALATAFTVLHPEVAETYTFNGLGLAAWDYSRGSLRDILDYYRLVLADPSASGLVFGESDPLQQLFAAARAVAGEMDYRSIYNDPRYQWAMAATANQFGTTYDRLSDPSRTALGGAENKITAIFGHATHNDAEWAANTGRHGVPVPVFIEGQPGIEWNMRSPLPFDFGNTHSIVLLADSLALMKTLQEIDPRLSQAQLQAILASGSNQRNSRLTEERVEADSLERVLSAIGKIADVSRITSLNVLRPVQIPRGFGDLDARERFYVGLDAVTRVLKDQGLTISPLIAINYGVNDGLQLIDTSAKDPIDVKEAALRTGDEGRAYRYALRELNPFVVFGPDYSRFNTQGELELYDAHIARAGMSERYLEDRADLMFRVLNVAVDNDLADGVDHTADSTGRDNEPLRWKSDASYYEDKSTEFRLGQCGQFRNASRVIFGRELPNLIAGAGFDDRLYGGPRSDVLAGGAGNDYLEGGLGGDLYEFSNGPTLLGRRGEGSDIILDADGKGVLRYTYASDSSSSASTTKIAGGVVFSRPDGGWQSADGKFTYNLLSEAMVVSVDGDFGGTLTLQNFRDGDFGIRLQKLRLEPNQFIREFIGDKEDWDSRSDPGIQAAPDGFGNTRRADGQDGRPDTPEANREDVFIGASDSSSERYTTAGGNDVVYGDGTLGRLGDVGGDDYIDAGAGRDVVEAGAGNDWVVGGEDGDIVGGNAGGDTIYADSSNGGVLTLSQAIVAGETASSVEGLGDLLSGDGGADVLIGGDRNDLLFGGSDIDVVSGGAGNDTIYGDGTLTFSAFDWNITRKEVPSSTVSTYLVQSDTVVFSASGTEGDYDAIYGGTGDDWIFAGGGDDYIEGGSGSDVMFGEAGADLLIGGAEDDVLSGDSSTVTAAGLGGDDFLDGGDGRDVLQGDMGSDILYGGAGDDDLYGGEGDDLLYGGAGDDVLVGGPGKDTYLFNRGDGIEVIQDTASGADDAEASVVILGDGISRADVKFRKGSLLIDLGPADPDDAFARADAIHFLNFDSDFPERTSALGELRFADGSAMTYDDVLAQGFDIDGTEFDDIGEDSLIGTSVTDRIRGLAGSDWIDGRGGADVLTGNGGDDVLDGGDGYDQLFGGDDNDELRGGRGNDDLFGEAGDDTYILNIGDGEDAIDDFDGTSTLRFGPGTSPESISISRYTGDAGDDWTRIQYGAGDSVSLKSGADAVIAFDGGDEIKLSGLLGGLALTGTSQAEIIYGSDGDDTIDGKGGSDEIYAGPGDDVLVAGKHLFADSVYGEEGDDTFKVGTQAANLFGGPGSDSYLLSCVTHGQVQISDDGGRLVITNDSVFASLNVSDFGDVVYLDAPHFSVTVQDDGNLVDLGQWSIESPDGSVFSLADFAASRSTGETWEFSNYERQILGALLEAQSAVEAAGIDLTVDPSGATEYSGASVSEYVYDHVRYVTHRSYLHVSHVEVNVLESDAPDISVIGDDWRTIETMAEETTSVGLSTPRKSGNDFSRQAQQSVWVPVARPLPLATGYMRAVTSMGYADAYPTLRGYWVYPDVPVGGLLESIPISDRILLTNINHTVDSTLTMHEVHGGPSSNRIVTAGYGIVDAGGGDDVVTIAGVSALPLSSDLTFTVRTASDSEPEVVYGKPAHVYGGLLYGNSGNDSLSGAAGDDVLIGGTGSDILDGRSGGDRYVLFEGGGLDAVADTGDDLPTYERVYRLQNGDGSRAPAIAGDDYDAIRVLAETFDEGIGGLVVQSDVVELPFDLYSDTGYADDVEFFFDNGTLHIRSGFDVGVDIRLAQASDPVGTGIEYISFMDADLFIADALALVSSDEQGVEIYGAAETEVLLGGWGADRIEGHGGDDALYGRNGRDVLQGGDGADYMEGGAGDDVIDGEAGEDILRGSAGNDELVESGPDTNFMDGGAGDDYVLIDGRALVIGGAGDDEAHVDGDGTVVSFNVGDGHDTIQLAGEITLSIGGALANDDLGLLVDGNDVVLTLNSDDSVRLTRASAGDPWPRIVLQRIDGTGISRYDFSAVITDRYVQLATDRESPFILAAVLESHLVDNSHDEVIGGEVAYRYALHGHVDDMTTSEIHGVLDDETFGLQTQTVEPIGPGVLEGTVGDDILAGTAVADVISGGAGNDLLDGGLGDDTYVFRLGDGVDHIVDAGGFDTLTFGAGITEHDLSLGLGSLLVRVGQYDAIHIEDFDPADALAARSIDVFRFSDGAEVSYEQLVARGFDLTGTAGDDMIIGTNVSDSIAGGAGDDVLEGGAGDDVYSFNAGDGADTILDQSGADEIVLARGITADAIAVSESGGGITLTRRGTQDSIRIPGATREDPRIEAVQFSDGISWNSRDLVEHINDAPAAVVDVGEMVIVEDEPFEFALPAATFSDPDGWGTLTHEAAMSDGRALPDWLSFDAQLLTFSGTPSNRDVGVHDVMVTALDQDGLSASTTFTIAVLNVNDSPETVGSIPDRVIREDERATFSVSPIPFDDVDAGDVLTYTAAGRDGTALPDWLSFDAAALGFAGVPGNADVGEYALIIMATDLAGATATADFNLTVENENDAPTVAASLPNKLGYQSAVLDFTIPSHTFIDMDAGDALTLTATSIGGTALPAWLGFDPAAGHFVGRPDPSEVGSYALTVTATDRQGASASTSFDLIVSDAGAYSSVYRGTKRDDAITSGPGNDWVEAGKGADVVSTGAGRDIVFGDKGDDSLTLGYGNDIGFGGDGKDIADGGPGNDLLVGGDGADKLYGGTGNDVLMGGEGKDELSGGEGNNLVVGGPGGDVIYGGSGHDVLAFNRHDGKAFVYGGDASLPSNRDTLSFGSGIAAGDIVLRRNGKDLVVKIDDDREEREGGDVSVTLKDWYGAGNHRAVTRLQIVGDRTEIYDFAALVSRFDAVTRGKSTPWRAGPAMSAVLMFSGAQQAIGGPLATEYGKTGTIASVGVATFGSVIGDDAFAVEPQKSANGDGATLAQFFARDDQDEDAWSGPGLPDLGHLGGDAHRGERSADDGSQQRGGTNGRSGGVKPPDLQAILDAMERFEHDVDARRVERPAPSDMPDRNDGVPGWAMRNALLQFHLTAPRDVMFGADESYPGANATSTPMVNISAAQAALGVPGFGRDAQSLCAFDGLREGLARLA